MVINTTKNYLFCFIKLILQFHIQEGQDDYSDMTLSNRRWLWEWEGRSMGKYHSCQPLLGVNFSPQFVNMYFL